MSDSKTVWETHDLRLGAYLKTKKYSILGVRRNGNRIIFQFIDKDARTKDISDYHARRSVVEPVAYMGAIGELRDMITMMNSENAVKEN